MALSDITRKAARSDLRSRLAKLTVDEFTDVELNGWLNTAQFDVFVRLSSISDVWYGTKQAISLTAAQGAVTNIALASGYGADKIAKLKKLVLASGELVPFVGDSEVHSLKLNSNYDYSYAVCHFGEALDVFVGSSATALSSNSAYLYFIRKPDEMTADSGAGGTIDVPSEFYDLVILSALAKALFKLNMLGEKQAVDADIANKFNDIRSLYASEIQISQAEKVPGVQTPRMR